MRDAPVPARSGPQSDTSSGSPRYGLDAPALVGGCAVLAVAGLVLILIALVSTSSLVLGWGIWALVLGGGVAVSMTYSSRIGKPRVAAAALDRLGLRGDEDVLDLGCGSGLLVLEAAARLPDGTATGIDLWRVRDQAGSSSIRCRQNAERLGVTERVRLVDGDMRDLPFPDGSFDVVLACLAVHNVHGEADRRKVIDEAARVLRPAGRLVIIDIFGTATYVSAAAAAGLSDAHRTGLIRGIIPPARIVTASQR